MYAHRLIVCIATLCVLTLLRIPLYATPTDTLDTSEPWIAAPQSVGEADGDTIRGVVFADASRNGTYDDGEAGVEGVLVIRITSTDRHRRAFTDAMTIEVREERPPRYWREAPWSDE